MTPCQIQKSSHAKAMHFTLSLITLFDSLLLSVDTTFTPVEEGVPVYFQLEDYDEYLVPESEDEIDEIRVINPFYLDHKTAVRIPSRVSGYTTADMYREGYRQRKNCHPVLTNDYSLRKPGGRFLNNATDEQKLMCTLLLNYSKEIRPVKEVISVLTVNLSVTINQIFALDDRNQQLVLNVWFEQTWKDESLTWDPFHFNGLKKLNIPSCYIFTPDIELYNAAGEYTKRRIKFRAVVSFDGTVFYGNPVKLTSSCHVDPTWYPFDTQICRLKFGSWTYSGLEIDLQTTQGAADTDHMVTDGKWIVVKVVKKRHSVVYSCCPEPYVDISYYLVLKRRSLYYIISVYFFTATLAGMTLAVYQLPIDSREKCSLATAVLFSISVFMLSFTEKLPETSNYIPIINVYLFVIMAMSAASLMFTIGVSAIYFQNGKVTADCIHPMVPKVPPYFMRIVKFYRKLQGKAIAESMKKMKKKVGDTKEFISHLRRYQLSVNHQILRNLRTIGDAKNRETFQKILEISVAIDKLADIYERKVKQGYNLLEWHELAEFVDKVLFWMFCLFLFVAISLLVVYSSIRETAEDIDRMVEIFEANTNLEDIIE